jgi:uncharacterized membrane protein YfcA
MGAVRLVLIGLVGGLFSSLFGVGGGIVIVPLLILVAAFGTREAAATSLGAIVITALAGVTLYAFRGKVDVPYALLVGVPAMGGALIGTSAQRRISGRALSLAFAALLAGLGVWLLTG